MKLSKNTKAMLYDRTKKYEGIADDNTASNADKQTAKEWLAAQKDILKAEYKIAKKSGRGKDYESESDIENATEWP